MGAYDSSRFSKMFSERTEANYRYISKAVNRDEEEKRIQKEFLEKYTQVIKEIDVIKNELRREAGQIVNVQKKGKSELKRKLFSLSSSVEDSAKKLQSDLESLVSTEAIEGQKKKYIMELYSHRKWKSTFSRDLRNGRINEDEIVFGFLIHMRNVTCHSGNNAMSILPLTEGSVVSNVMFYDNLEGQEFAMNLSIEELEELVFKIAEFYRYSKIGEIDKTKSINEAEKRVNQLLGMD